MRPRAHVVQGLVSSALLYPIIGKNVIPFGLAVILIDMDHVIEYIIDTRDFSLKGVSTFYDILLKNKDKNYLGLSLFHTIEFYFLIFLFAKWFAILYYVLAGLIFHHIFDLISLIRHKILFVRAFSVIEYFIRRKRHIVSVKEMLRLKNVNTEGIPELEKWMLRWGVKNISRK
jgi:hypothetical protein